MKKKLGTIDGIGIQTFDLNGTDEDGASHKLLQTSKTTPTATRPTFVTQLTRITSRTYLPIRTTIQTASL